MSSTDCMIEKAHDFKAAIESMETAEDSKLLRAKFTKALTILLKAADFYKRHQNSGMVDTESFLRESAEFCDEMKCKDF